MKVLKKGPQPNILVHDVFDLIRNEAHKVTTSDVQCLICKTSLETEQSGDKIHGKNWNSCLSLIHNTTFYHTYKLYKIPKQFICPQKIIQYHKNLCYIVLSYAVLVCLLFSGLKWRKAQ